MFSLEMLEILAPALAATLIIAFVHVPLGIEVLRRGIIFIDLAIAQIAGLGVVMAELYLEAASGLAVQLAALGAALLAAGFFRWIERRAPALQEAVIGTVFVVAASVALLLLADHPHGGEEIQHLLSGQVLFVTWQAVLAHGPVYALILLIWFLRPSVRAGSGFYLLFALAITSSVQLVGVYVVFASLILPALVAVHYPRYSLRAAWSAAALAVLGGLGVATWRDLPAGPVLVIAYALTAVAGTAAAQWHRPSRNA